MNKIEKLTPDQENDLAAFRAEYFRLGTLCEPADRPRAEAAFTKAYATIGKNAPKVIWVDSPLSASIMIHLFGDKKSMSSLDDRLRSSLGSSLRRSLFSSLFGSLRSSLFGSLFSSLGGSLRRSLFSSLGGSLRRSLFSSLDASKINPQYAYFWGQQDLYWVAFYKFCQKIGVNYDAESQKKLDIMDEIGRSCNWWYPYEGLVIAVERPVSIVLDDQERQHNMSGPSVEFRDGWKVYASHGGIVLAGGVYAQAFQVEYTPAELRMVAD